MPRRSRRRAAEQRISVLKGPPEVTPTPCFSNELPQTAEACAREMELLEEQNKVLMDRLTKVTAQLQHALRKKSKSPVMEKPPTSGVASQEETGEKRTTRSEVEVQGSEIDSNTEDEERMPASNLEIYRLSRSEKQEDEPEEEVCSPLIAALKKLQKRRDQKRGIKMWSHNLANLFGLTDQDQSGYIDEQEYLNMINGLDISQELKATLKDRFYSIDQDGNGINLTEFLMFFLNFPMFQQELLRNSHNNAPYIYEKTLTWMQHWRQWLYCVVEHPEYNFLSKTLFCTDFILTLIPIIILCTEGGQSSLRVNWFKHSYMWFVSIFFASEYFCALITCKYRKKFVFDVIHTFELVSFIFWIYYNTIGHSDTLDPKGFVVFRVIRYYNLHKVFKLTVLEEDINIYVNTLHLAYTSSGAVLMLLVFTIFLFSLLMYVFERGNYNEDLKRWERPEEEEESPFADMSGCIYFVIVTMTTLGYGDFSPISLVGRMVAVITVFMGLCNITFLINIVGDCFEEVFREFVMKRSKTMDEERAKFLESCVYEAQDRNSTCLSFRSKKKRLRHIEVLANANDRL